jgi:oligopeptide transport system permease protein
MHAVPGGPFDTNPDKPLPPATIAALEEKYNLDGSIADQYVSFMQDLLKGDLGHSFARNVPVTDVFSTGAVTTLQLGACAFLFSIVVGVGFGILSAFKQNSPLDYFGVAFTTFGVAVPNFVMAVFLIVVFSVQFGWFDVLGWELGNYKKMVLPTVALGVLPASYIARITRASMIEVLRQDFIRTARSKGLDERRVIFGHAARNAAIPLLTVTGPIFAGLLTGSFIIERTFAINGIGDAFVSSVALRDYGVIMGAVLLYAAAIAVMNLMVDLAYGLADPRIRY